MPRRLPQYVQSWTDRETGRTYFYFRREGYSRRRLPGPPFSEEFMAALAAANRREEIVPLSRSNSPGSFSALCVTFYNSAAFKGMRQSTRQTYRLVLEKLRVQASDKSIATLTTVKLQEMYDARADKPSAARQFIKVLRAACAAGVRAGLLKTNPCIGVELGKRKPTKGIHTWTEEEVSQYEARHPIGTKARLALALMLFTGQRKGDVVRMGWQHVRNGYIYVAQEKSGGITELYIPIHPELQQILDATSRSNMTFLMTQWGKPFSKAGYGNWVRDRCDEAELPQCSAHGLRKSICRRLAQAGCTPHEIKAISGHKNLQEVEMYTREVRQKELAVQAMQKVTGTKPQQKVSNSIDNFDDPANKERKSNA